MHRAACGALFLLLVSFTQLSCAGRRLTADAAASQEDWLLSMPTSVRAQAQACHAQLAQLAAAREPSAISTGGTWDAVDQRRRDILAALDKWHVEHHNQITEGHSGASTTKQQFYLALAQIPCVKVVCEIGFNAGHSTAVWLAARDDIHVVSFDLGLHPYAFSALQFYATNYPGRITTTFGNSMVTVPYLATKMAHSCDLLVVDGGHVYQDAIADIENMIYLARPAFNVFVMDDVNCINPACPGPNKALQEAVDKQLVTISMKYAYREDNTEAPPMSADALRGFSFGSYNLTLHHRHHHQWKA